MDLCPLVQSIDCFPRCNQPHLSAMMNGAGNGNAIDRLTELVDLLSLMKLRAERAGHNSR